MKKLVAAGALALALAGGLAACTGTTGTPAPIGAEASIDATTTIVDVRTPAEFATGHLAGAVNIDVQSDGFDAAIGELDPAGNYFVYCRSGNRSAQAIERMTDAGFSQLVNGGSLTDAAGSSGLAIVTE